MHKLAKGDLSVDLSRIESRHEIGQSVLALDVFQTNALTVRGRNRQKQMQRQRVVLHRTDCK